MIRHEKVVCPQHSYAVKWYGPPNEMHPPHHIMQLPCPWPGCPNGARSRYGGDRAVVMNQPEFRNPSGPFYGKYVYEEALEESVTIDTRTYERREIAFDDEQGGVSRMYVWVPVDKAGRSVLEERPS